ncbi:PREDICTED: uncharacterized protein LOC108361583 isoform X2 [Rhagoletis zephyria]|nr:PREDICTED: uncharacterized protein LOC108361583 isoform X2 [Rhagoletis zephyria]
MFTTIIDKDPDLTDVEKMQHLRTSLKGAALDTIRSLEISDLNYNIALELLQKRFNNKRLIFQAHITEILGLKRVEASSAVKLRELSDKVNANLRALLTIGDSEQVAAGIIIHTLLEKVDGATQTKWEETAPLDVIPSCEQFTTFLEKRCQKLENVEHSVAASTRISQVGKNSRNTNSSRKSFISTNTSNGCVLCDTTDHSIYSCSRFNNLSPQLRLKEAKRLSLCINCLRRGHQLRACAAGSCRSCGGKHHSSLHLDHANSRGIINEQQNPPLSSQSTPQHPHRSLTVVSPSVIDSSGAPNLNCDVVLLATAVVDVKNSAGTWVPCRALLDSGSQLHIITSRLAQQLQLRKTKSFAAVSGLGDSEFQSDGFTVNINLRSQTSEYTTFISALVAPNITDNQPNFSLNIASWNIPSNIRLADKDFHKSQRVDMLIGASLFYDLLCVGQIKLASGLPLLQKTRLGWVVTGGDSKPRTARVLNAVSSTKPSTQLDQLVRRFWELESCASSVVKYTKEEIDCESHFKANFTRLSTGDYSVRLPIKPNICMLGESYPQALRRFLNLERKLDRQRELKQNYAAFMQEYLDLGHMSLVSEENRHLCKYFLPHHCVMKEDSTTTKLRVVFDGSAASSTGYSLNDVLMTGPTIQPKLYNILLRFRTFSVALTGDICKMYRCVRVSEDDSYLQCVLWRDTSQHEVQVFKLGTVTYGTRPAAFLSVRAMHQLASDEQKLFPVGAEILRRDFYVDDLIAGGDSVQEVREIMNQITNMLAKGCFKLRKWCTNNVDLLQGIPSEDTEPLLSFDDGSNVTKTLGLTWDPASDSLLFVFTPTATAKRNCKRSILSIIARFYDPLGLIGPNSYNTEARALWSSTVGTTHS